MADERQYIKVPLWLFQSIIAAVLGLMVWALQQAYTEMAQINTHLVATDLRVTILEHNK